MGELAAWMVASAPLAIIACVWISAALAQLFRKTGEEGWRAWVPVANAVTLLRLGGFRAWWLLLALVPVLGWIALAVVFAVTAHRIGRVLGLGAGMTVLAVLLPPVWLSVAGWGSSRYAGIEHPSTRRLRAMAPSRARRGDEPDGPWPFGDTLGDVLGVKERAGLRAAPYRPQQWSAPPVGAPQPVRPVHAQPFDDPEATIIPRAVATAAPGEPAPPVQSSVAPTRSAPLDPPLVHRGATRHEVPVAAAVPPAPAQPQAPVGATVTELPARDGVASSPIGELLGGPVRAIPGMRIPPRPAAPAAAAAAAKLPSEESPAAAHVSTVEAEAVPADALVVRRIEGRWMLVPVDGAPVELTSRVAIVGRNPSSDPAFPGAQLVRVRDRSRTMSKTHARIELRDDGWIVVDLGSTNGVIVVDLDGSAYDATPGAPARVAERLVLGDVEMRLAGVA